MKMTEMNRRDFGGVMMGAGALFSQAAASAQRRRPNILFICSDEHTGTYMGCQGHPLLRTPNMDRLAARGTLFRNAYSNAPVCVPGRTALMTGRFASDVDSYSNSTCFAGGVPTWGNLLRDAGYHCWATGKLDLTKGLDFGFEEVDTDHGHSVAPDITSLFRAPVSYRVDIRDTIDGSFTERVHHDEARVNRALGFLRNEAPKLDRPWAAYVGLTLPHPPFVAHQRYASLYLPDRMPLPNTHPEDIERLHIPLQVLRDFLRISTPIPEERVRRARAAYLGMITELDGYLGQLLDEIERQGQSDHTFVVYTADHGEMLGEHGLWTKFNLLENSARIPMIIAGAGFAKGKVVDTPVSAVDLTPTMLEVAGAPPGEKLRGHSLLSPSHPGYAFSESLSEGNCTGSYMIRKGDWKYIQFTWYGNLLFNLKTDPGEIHNLAGRPEHRKIEGELHGALQKLIDPEAVTRRCFDRHNEVLDAMVRQNDSEQFYKLLEKRLGRGQARSMTYLHYHGKMKTEPA
jgi:choline-sulfatase